MGPAPAFPPSQFPSDRITPFVTADSIAAHILTAALPSGFVEKTCNTQSIAAFFHLPQTKNQLANLRTSTESPVTRKTNSCAYSSGGLCRVPTGFPDPGGVDYRGRRDTMQRMRFWVDTETLNRYNLICSRSDGNHRKTHTFGTSSFPDFPGFLSLHQSAKMSEFFNTFLL